MAKLEQKYLVDREAVEHLIAMLRDGLANRASDKELWEQTLEILDSEYRSKTEQALKELKGGKVKRFRSTESMIRDLRSN